MDDGQYEIVSVDVSEKSPLDVLLDTHRLKHRQSFVTVPALECNGLAYPSEVIDCDPWTVHVISDDLLAGMWEFRPWLTHFVTVGELWKGLELGIVSLKTTIQDGETKYFVIVANGNDDKWRLHLRQQEWKRYQAARQEKQAGRPKKRAAFAD